MTFALVLRSQIMLNLPISLIFLDIGSSYFNSLENVNWGKPRHTGTFFLYIVLAPKVFHSGIQESAHRSSMLLGTRSVNDFTLGIVSLLDRKLQPIVNCPSVPHPWGTLGQGPGITGTKKY